MNNINIIHLILIKKKKKKKKKISCIKHKIRNGTHVGDETQSVSLKLIHYHSLMVQYEIHGFNFD